MTLTKEQIKTAKQACIENGKNPKFVQKELGQGFWDELCNGTFEGYISWLIGYVPQDLQKWIDMGNRSHQNIMAGKAGASHFN